MQTEQKNPTPVESPIYGSFYLEENEFSLSVSYVQEVVNPPAAYSSLPLAPPFLKGLFNLRGAIIPVIDLRKIFRLPERAAGLEQTVAILELGGASVGLLFDRTGEIFKAHEDERCDFEQTPDAGVISGVFKRDNGKRLVQILNVSRLFSLQGILLQSDVARNGNARTLAQKRGQRKQCVSFGVGPSKCALGIDEIREILKVDQIKRSVLASKHCVGMIDVRGTIVPVLDFATLLGYAAEDIFPEATQGSRRIMVLKNESEYFGLQVDFVDSIVSYFPDELISFPVLTQAKSEMFHGCISQENGTEVLLLNSRYILSQAEIAEITQSHSKLYRENQETNRQKAAKRGARKTYITFSVESSYAVRIEDVKEIIEMPDSMLQPPGLPAHFRGVLNLRGELVPIVDARAMYSGGSGERIENAKVLVFKKDSAHFGLVVDAVEAIVSFSDADKTNLPEMIYKQSSNKLAVDVTEAVEIRSEANQTRSLLILNADSIAARVANLVLA